MTALNYENEVVAEEQWISVSDLMSALMMIFLLLSLFYMIQLDEDRNKVAIDYEKLLIKSKNLEENEANAQRLLAEKAKLLSVTKNTIDELVLANKIKDEQIEQSKIESIDYETLLSKTKSLEEKQANAERLLAEKSMLLAETTSNMKELVLANKLKDQQINEVVSEAVIYEDVIKELHQSLLGEFNADLKKWNAELRDDLTFRFNEPAVLFDTGDTTIKPKFKRILNDFFPRYLNVITSEKFKKDIAEVRIEGHTSSVWGDLPRDSQEAYFYNMNLSQERSRETLFYVMTLPESKRNYEWLKDRLIANGLSSSKLVDRNGLLLSDENSDGVEDQFKSQRVEFRVRIDAESKITKMLDSAESR